MATGGSDPLTGADFTPKTAPCSKKLSDILRKLKPGIPKPEFYSTPTGAHASLPQGYSLQFLNLCSCQLHPPLFLGKQGHDFELSVKRFEVKAKLHAQSNEEKVIFFPTMLEDEHSVYSHRWQNSIRVTSKPLSPRFLLLIRPRQWMTLLKHSYRQGQEKIVKTLSCTLLSLGDYRNVLFQSIMRKRERM